jgi:monofunctional biosynthetic peptidoglycan transglycosylase
MRILLWFAAAIAVFLLGSTLWVLAYRFVNPPITFTQLGDMLGGRRLERQWMAIERIDRDMVRAVIGGEDSKFCTHSGFDRQAIEAAMRRNARGGAVIRGGSTISQQTAKNAFLWQGGGYFRKGLEAWFTLLIETLWSKRRIMEVYLNVAETGIGTYGVNAGAQRYFGHDASTLSRAEAARIAAVLPLPKRREAAAPSGFTRRYGNMISARMAVVARGGLDACVYQGAAPPRERPEAVPMRRPLPPRSTAPATPRVQQQQAPLPGEEYETQQPTSPRPAPEDPSLPPEPEVNGM